MKKLSISRRHALKTALFGPGYIGLQSLATGIPISALMNGIPNTAHALEDSRPQYLILTSRSAGDPINANAPGTYVDGVVHNPSQDLAATNFFLGDQRVRAARPWSTLPQRALDQTTFIHHRTYQNVHAQHDNVMGLLGNARGPTGTGTEVITSLYSSETAGMLGTIQQEPIALAENALTFEGRALQSVQPQTLATLFTPETGVGLQLQRRRQISLDRINAELRTNGTPTQRRWLDRYASSQDQIESLDESLLGVFSGLSNNNERSQIQAAIALIQMQVAPVIQIGIDFGGDNHRDGGLTEEATKTISGMASLTAMFEQLRAVGLQDRVTVANLNVFGRTLREKGTRGRNHNLNHHVMMVSGANVNPGVIGSVARSGNDFGATAINSTTGAGGGNADIPANQTLEAATKTLGCALGISADRMNTRINRGKIIRAALKS